MRIDHLNYHLNRRDLISGMAKLGAAGAWPPELLPA